MLYVKGLISAKPKANINYCSVVLFCTSIYSYIKNVFYIKCVVYFLLTVDSIYIHYVIPIYNNIAQQQRQITQISSSKTFS